MKREISMLWIWLWVTVVICNTEPYILQVPKYYEVPGCTKQWPSQHVYITEKHSIVNDFPILNVSTINQIPSITIQPSQPFDKIDHGSVLVKLNNYYNSTYDSNDILFIKVCWPAIFPVGFNIKHEFLAIESNEVDIYLNITYSFDYNTILELVELIEFNLIIEKLPRKIPIPIEVYDVILYQMDIVIMFIGGLYLYKSHGGL